MSNANRPEHIMRVDHRSRPHARTLALVGIVAATCTLSSARGREVSTQPVIGARSKAILTVDGLRFKDANGSAQLDAYEDWRLPVESRVADLVSRMTLEENTTACR